MKRALKTMVIITMMMMMFGILNAQTRGGSHGSIRFNGSPVVGIELEVVLYMKNSTVAIPTGVKTTTTTGGSFAFWITDHTKWPDTVFERVAVRGKIPYCHTFIEFTTQAVKYSHTAVEPIHYNRLSSGGMPVCWCETIRPPDM